MSFLNGLYPSKLFEDKWSILLFAAFIGSFLGSAITDIIFTIIGLAVVLDIVRNRSMSDIKFISPLNILILIWIAANILGYFASVDVREEQIEEILGLRWAFSIYFCVYLGTKLNVKISYVTSAYLVASLLIIWAIFQHQSFDGYRFFGFYKNANVFSMALLIPWAFLVGFFSTTYTNRFELLIRVLALLTFSIGLFFSYTRGAWFSILIVLFFTALISKNKKYIFAVGSIVGVSVTMFILNFKGFADRILYSFDLTTGSSQSLRLVVWKVSWQTFLDHPWFGIGFYESYRMFPKYYELMGLQNNMILTHSHNQFLQVLVSGGIVGFTAYVLIFFLLFKYFYFQFKSRKDTKNKSVALGSMLVILSYMLISIPECPLMSNEPRGFLILYLAVCYGYLQKNGSQLDRVKGAV